MSTPAEIRADIAKVMTTNFAAIPLQDQPIEGTVDWHINQIMQLIAALYDKVAAEVIGENEQIKPWLGDAGGIRNIMRDNQRLALQKLREQGSK